MEFGRPRGALESWSLPGRTQRMTLSEAEILIQAQWPAAHWNATCNVGYWYDETRRVVGQGIALPTALALARGLSLDLWWVRLARD